MKYRPVSLTKLLAIFGLAVIYGCSALGPNEIQRAEVPPDFPFAVVWLQPEAETAKINELTERELLGLVIVKKWNEGDRDFVGMSMQNGKVYLHYPDVVYVKWEEDQLPDGTIRKYASLIYGPGGDSTITDQVSEGVLPPGVQVLDMDSSGIDPYEYLSN